MDTLDTTIEETSLSQRVKNCLHNRHIVYVKDLIDFSVTDLSMSRNFGWKSVLELQKFMEKLGVSLLFDKEVRKLRQVRKNMEENLLIKKAAFTSLGKEILNITDHLEQLDLQILRLQKEVSGT